MPRQGTLHDYCVRCGTTKAEIRRMQYRCWSWGVTYNSHIYTWIDEGGFEKMFK